MEQEEMRVLRGVVYMTKSSGPRTEPWGTPKEEVYQEDRSVSHFTRKQRDDRYDLNQLRTEPWIPNQDERKVDKRKAMVEKSSYICMSHKLNIGLRVGKFPEISLENFPLFIHRPHRPHDVNADTNNKNFYFYYYYTRLTASLPGQPG